jgi:hypothetical protein
MSRHLLVVLSAALLLLVSPIEASASPALPPGPEGEYCVPETSLRQEVDETGNQYMEGYGKLICDLAGATSTVNIVLYQDGVEVARKGSGSPDTVTFASVAVKCGLLAPSRRVTWFLVAQYNELQVGQTFQNRRVVNSCLAT